MPDEQKTEANAQSPTPKASCPDCAEAIAGWKRALADYDNLKKDLARARAGMRQDAVSEAARAFIAVLDNFDQAVKHVPEGLDDKMKAWVNGVLFIRIQLENALRDLGLEPFGAVGEAFDPLLHEIIAEREEAGLPERPESSGRAGKPEHTILEITHRGWKIGERIIRPARVVVKK